LHDDAVAAEGAGNGLGLVEAGSGGGGLAAEEAFAGVLARFFKVGGALSGAEVDAVAGLHDERAFCAADLCRAGVEVVACDEAQVAAGLDGAADVLGAALFKEVGGVAYAVVLFGAGEGAEGARSCEERVKKGDAKKGDATLLLRSSSTKKMSSRRLPRWVTWWGTPANTVLDSLGISKANKNKG
jgi:hypothetical protein